MESTKRIGILYGKLGLATDLKIVEARIEGVKAAANELKAKSVPALVQAALGLRSADEHASFLALFAGIDPTFDVSAGDKEAALLAASVASHEMESDTDVSGVLALCVVTATLVGTRSTAFDDQWFGLATKTLAEAQGKVSKSPADRKYTKQTKAILDATTALSAAAPTNAYSQVQAQVATALDALGKYAEGVALAGAQSDNELLAHMRKLESEASVYWWATAGWSKDVSKPFHELPAVEAAIRSGKELSEKTTWPLGLFAAPAILDMVVERGRTPSKAATIAEIAIGADRAWRRSAFAASAAGSYADLLPLTSAMGMAALSDDADDWQPRFKRLTNIDPKQKLKVRDIGLQIYRECLALRCFD